MSFFKSRFVRCFIVVASLIALAATGIHYRYYIRPIPKVIHYVWVGPNAMPGNFPAVLESWQKHAPDYRINKIDETVCDVNANAFVRQAYAEKSFNFVSDYCRFVTLEKEGGLYLDTDHLLTASPDKWLKGANRVLTLERQDILSGSFIAVRPHDPFIQTLLKHYETHHFKNQPLPFLLSMYFNAILDIKKAKPFHEKNGTRILPVNIAMINFGGGENIATHLYDNANADKEQNGYYYNIFKNIFLEESTLPLCNGNDERQSFILDTPASGYAYQTQKQARIIYKTPAQLTLHWQDNGTPTAYRYVNGCWYRR